MGEGITAIIGALVGFLGTKLFEHYRDKSKDHSVLIKENTQLITQNTAQIIELKYEIKSFREKLEMFYRLKEDVSELHRSVRNLKNKPQDDRDVAEG